MTVLIYPYPHYNQNVFSVLRFTTSDGVFLTQIICLDLSEEMSLPKLESFNG